MTETLRTQLFLKSIYNEASQSKKGAAMTLVNQKWAFREEYNLLKEAKEALPKLRMNPAETVLQAITNYSRNQAASFQMS